LDSALHSKQSIEGADGKERETKCIENEDSKTQEHHEKTLEDAKPESSAMPAKRTCN
jgi:hypothetical protein